MTGQGLDYAELAGRGAVLAVLSDVLTACVERGDALLLVGEPGIGKTACLSAAGAMARSAGYLVVEAAGLEAETQLPFAGLHRLLRPLIDSADDLPDVQRSALLSAVGLHDDERGDRFVVSVATVNLLRHAIRLHPLVITADDIHWLDDETQHVLAFVARRLEHHLVIVATAPSGNALPGLRDAFRELRVDRLGETASRQLLDRRAAGLDPAQRGWVLSHALGNPLALIELAAAPIPIDSVPINSVPINSVPINSVPINSVPINTVPINTVPINTVPINRLPIDSPIVGAADLDPMTAGITLSPLLERAFAGHLQDVSKSGRDVLLVAAVAAYASLPEILAATARLSGQPVTLAALEPVQALGLLDFDETRLTFTHPLVKAAIAQREPISRRQAAHRALGAVITVNSYRRAWHRALGTARYDDAVADELEATTADCIRRGDVAAAVLALERAAHLTTAPAERGRRLLLAARQAARLGRPDLVDRLLGGVITGELTAFDRVRAELFRESVGGVVIDDSNRVDQLCTIADHAMAAGETELAIELADAAARRRCVAPVDAVALSRLTSLARELCSDPDARSVAVLALADPIGHAPAVLSALADVEDSSVTDGGELSAYGVAARAVGHYVLAARFLDRAEIPLRTHGLLGQLARNLCVVADLRVELGDWDGAQAALAEFATLSAASMSASHRTTALATTARIAALRGDTATALELVSEIEHSPAARSGSRYLARAQIVRGIAGIASDQHLEAFAALSRVLEPSDPSHHFREQFDAVAFLAEAAARAGRQGQAYEVVERMQRIADVSGAPLLLTQLCYARAVLAPDDVAEQNFMAALASDAAGSPWPRARIQLAYGCWLRRQQRVTQSRAPLQSALTVLQQLGAARWAKEARDELEAAGAHGAGETETSSAHALSVQEFKIARLAAQGLSNREIGQQFNLSPRTVSSHLYRIFPKLGISARGQIGAQLEEKYPVRDSV